MKASGPLLPLLLLLAGCGGTPTSFYSLAPLLPARSGNPARTCNKPPLAVAHVLLPGALDRAEIVRLAGPDRLDISGHERWAGPLDEMVQRTLAEDLRLRLSPRTVLLPGDPVPPNAERIEAVLQIFAAAKAGPVMLQADWTLRDATGNADLTRAETIQLPAAPGSDPAAAMDRALAALADRMQQALQPCPPP